MSAYDPIAERRARELLPEIDIADSVTSVFDGADAAVLVTEWPEFAEIDWKDAAARMTTPLLVDGRNFLDPETIRDAGLIYEGIGRPNEVRD